ncbi:FIM3 [Symbiodinium necroappetens]|uniref:FIM3 protein n=1 Tax=Symbiodinium necroappetens TaxID=1628268 RepID=A0A812VGG3_9DINO|nr:FIM3 [Symbiodinium necroappetens]
MPLQSFSTARQRPRLPALDGPLSAREARRSGRDTSRLRDTTAPNLDADATGGLEAGYPALPPALGAALGDPVSLLALEDWHKTHSGLPEEQQGYESKLLACEARFRKIERLSARLNLPNSVVTAVAADLLRDVVDTLPGPIQKMAGSILRQVEKSIYSDEPTSPAERQQLAEVLGGGPGGGRPGREDLSERQPWFAVVRRQQVALERMEEHVADMQEVVDLHLARRKSVLDFIVRLQGQERLILQQWLFNFWVFTYRERKARMEKMSTSVLAVPDDLVTPFLSWRLYLSQQRLVRARAKCAEVDKEASQLANKITEVEVENHEQQRLLEESLAAGAELKEKCMVEQQELSRLKQVWADTQPELLLKVLAQTLEVFFGLVVRQAGLKSLEVRHRLARKDIRPLFDEDGSVDTEAILIRWINLSLDKARRYCEDWLDNLAHVENQDGVIMIAQQEDIDNLEHDLSDGVALTALYAMIKAERDQRKFSEKDLMALSEPDKELRTIQLCHCFMEVAPTERAKCLLVPHEIMQGSSDKLQTFLAAIFLDFPMLQDAFVSGSAAEALYERLCKVLDYMEAFAGRAGYEPLADPTPLLHAGEETQALATISVQQILLRWINAQLSMENPQHRPVENFGSDLQDGIALSKLLTIIAPEACPVLFSENREERLDQVIAAATRCGDGTEVLTVNAVVEGQSDMLACFVAALLLVRPNLSALPDSLLAMHLMKLEEVCGEGFAAVSIDNPSETMKFCLELDGCWQEFRLAAQAVQEASKTMSSILERVHAFLGETLSHRARGQPKTMLDAKELREFHLYTQVNADRLSQTLGKEAGKEAGKEEKLEPAVFVKLEEQLRRHFRLLRDIYKHYSSSSPSGAHGVALEGLLKLFQECKLRSKELAPHHLEVIFNDHLEDKSKTGEDRLLASHEFVEVLVQCANKKFRSACASPDNLAEQMLLLIDLHLRPNACNDAESMFQKMAYSPEVRQVLDQHSRELKDIFQLYATLDMSTTDAMQRASTMNITEFQMLLDDTGFLDEALTEVAVQQIFQGIQQDATAADDEENAGEPEDGAGLDDDDEMSFSEFLDGLVAVAAYKYPDPFIPLSSRINTFLLQLFVALRKHWSRKRGAPQVDAMLNALQKKMR